MIAGAKAAVLGTNPICIAVPAKDGPVVLDMATSAFPWYGVLEAQRSGTDLPPGIAIEASGHDTVDAAAVASGGAVKPFGGHKGSGLALMVELLAGPLVGAAVADKVAEANWGNLVVALDPALMQVRSSRERAIVCNACRSCVVVRRSRVRSFHLV